MHTEQKHLNNMFANERLKGFREHNDKCVKKLKNEHKQAIQNNEEERVETLERHKKEERERTAIEKQQRGK